MRTERTPNLVGAPPGGRGTARLEWAVPGLVRSAQKAFW